MTYTNVQLVLDGDAAQRERYAPLVARFELMKELAEVLNRRRYKRGSIDFDLPEPVIEFDEQGAMKGIRRSERLFAHRLIEEFMLAANEAVAGHLEAKLPESIYRVHEPPDPSRVADFEELALRFGHTLGLAAIPVKRFSVVDRKRDGRKIRKDIVQADERLQVTSQCTSASSRSWPGCLKSASSIT
jgi:ribonuclease R